MPCDDLEVWVELGGREVSEGGDIQIHRAASCCCTTETNRTL